MTQFGAFPLATSRTIMTCSSSPHENAEAVARDYDDWDSAHRSVARQRRSLVHRLSGRILEIAIGTGLNLDYYPSGADVTGIDVDVQMLRRAMARARHRPRNATKLLHGDAESLPFMDASFDVAVGTFVFCSVDNPAHAAAELRRVVRPGGRFVTLGYHTPMVAKILQSAGWKIRSEREWADSNDDRPIGKIIAINPRPSTATGPAEA